ncbi:ribosomal protein L30 [Emergomyces africanus]|uniref:Large ribosomal subunit protein uL30m n=1 Tax=Emergomyces africanus TaxID=1955775 RepID=A0A1B7NP81_9EURO|nr:ribosomal protein L30 [Emergomyces africanus]
MTYFRITLIRSAIGLPRRTTGVLMALGLKKRMQTVFYPVTPDVAGQIMKVKELVSVREVDKPLTKLEVHLERKPDPGYYIEQRAEEVFKAKREAVLFEWEPGEEGSPAWDEFKLGHESGS